MSAFRFLLPTLLSAFLISPFVSSQVPNSPSPAPQQPADVPSPSPQPPSLSPSPSPSVNSPPSDSSPSSSPSPSPSPTPSRAPAPGTNAPAPSVPSDMGRDVAAAEENDDSGGGGLSGGQKAGIAIGVIAGVAIVGAGAVVYKKRQSNIRRSQLGYDARRDIL